MAPVPGRVPCLVRLELEVIRASEPALERLGLEVIREFSSVAVYALVRSGEEVIRGSLPSRAMNGGSWAEPRCE